MATIGLRGRSGGVKVGNTVTWVVDAAASTTTNTAPLTNNDIYDARGADKVMVQSFPTASASHAATDYDINVLVSPTEGGIFDVNPYAERNLSETTDSEATTWPITPPAGFFKLALDKNSGSSNKVAITAIVSLEYRE